jgi:anti-anti-sigma regulatory factor
MDFMRGAPMNCELCRSGDEMLLKLQGECSIEYAKELQSVLIEGLEKSEALRVDLSMVTKVDTSFLQLLCAALTSCARSGRRVLIAENFSAEFMRFARDTGYWHALGKVLG